MKVALALTSAAVAVGVAAWAMPSSAPFDPVAFFAGKSHGEGTMHQLFKGDRHVRVDSEGRIAKDGSLVLDQRVAIAGEPARSRRWTLRPAGPNGWAGTLTDADGKVEATREGDVVRIRYKMDGGLRVEQTLTPRPGGRTVDNAMKIRKFGLVVAHLDEVIAKR